MTRPDILNTALSHVTRDRTATHGNPENNFATIASFWTTYLRGCGILSPDAQLSTYDIAALMSLMKISRIITSPEHADHWIDLAGYAACGGELATTSRQDSNPIESLGDNPPDDTPRDLTIHPTRSGNHSDGVEEAEILPQMESSQAPTHAQR